jgi:D-sedoheptulose 7-phosphate isomerase
MVDTTNDCIAKGKIEDWMYRSIKVKSDLYRDSYQVEKIYKLAKILSSTIQTGHKVLVCGNGGSSSDSGHLVGELMNQFCMGRTMPLAAIDLTAMSATMTAISNDWGYEDVFSKQVRGLGKAGDLLIAISTSGNSPSILQALVEASYLNMTTALLTGDTTNKPPIHIKRKAKGKEAVNFIVEPDIIISVPSNDTPIIQESHIMILHILVYMLDWIRSGVDYFDKETW